MEDRPLSAEARRVFEWAARHAQSKVCFWFGEVERDCGIDSDHGLHAILTTLQEYPRVAGSHWQIVKAIYPEEQHGEGAFEVSAHADRAWAEYCSWEGERLCPQCKKPQLRKVTVLRCQNPECNHEHDLVVEPTR